MQYVHFSTNLVTGLDQKSSFSKRPCQKKPKQKHKNLGRVLDVVATGETTKLRKQRCDELRIHIQQHANIDHFSAIRYLTNS